tara:strand:- start:712 stop:2409 length:1698 start_codon:yes stop_codon:yes gene_type:complete
MGIFDFLKKNKNIDNDNGLNETYYNDGKGELKTRGYKKNGKLYGKFEIYFENGQLNSEGNWKEGKKEGLWKEMYKNGSLKHEENWKNGRPDGLWMSYYENGQVERDSIFKNGIEEEVKYYNTDGDELKEKKKVAKKKAKKKIDVSSDSIEDVKKLKKKRTSNSKLRIHTDEIERIEGVGYYQGKPFTGIYYSLYPNGNLVYETEKLNGLDHGISKRYNSDSTIHSVVNFSDGKVHDEDEGKHNEFLKKYLYEELSIPENKESEIEERKKVTKKKTPKKKYNEGPVEIDKQIKEFVLQSDLEIVEPDHISLIIEVKDQIKQNDVFGYYYNKKPFSGTSYILHNKGDLANPGELFYYRFKHPFTVIENVDDFQKEYEKSECGKKEFKQKGEFSNMKNCDGFFIGGEEEDGVIYINKNPEPSADNMILSKNIFEREFNIKNGVMSGAYKVWGGNKRIKIFSNYKNGKRNGLCKWWFESGQLEIENNFQNDKLHGLCKWWYENGKLKKEETYMNGLQEGTGKNWHENGQKMYFGEFKNGEASDGLHQEWDENGTLTTDVIVKDGVPHHR